MRDLINQDRIRAGILLETSDVNVNALQPTQEG